jgi:hypothetical protein
MGVTDSHCCAAREDKSAEESFGKNTKKRFKISQSDFQQKVSQILQKAKYTEYFTKSHSM